VSIDQSRVAWGISLLSALGVAGVGSAQVTFVPLTPAVPEQPLFIHSLSADGSTAVGQSGWTVPWEANSQPVQWRGATEILPDLSGTPWPPRGIANGASADGSIVVGHCLNIGLRDRAVMWTNGQPAELSVAPNTPFDGTTARDVSDDGSVAVGLSFKHNQTYKAHRWVNGVPSLIPGAPGSSYDLAVGVSGDGSVVAGYSVPGPPFASYGTGWVWRNGSTSVLESVAGSIGVWIERISTDGLTIVGQTNLGSMTSGDRWVATTWHNGMAQLLDEPTGIEPETFAKGISANGSIVVGQASGGWIGDEYAAIWDDQHGLRDLNTVLIELGADLHGWHLQTASDISSDGLTIAGVGIDPLGNEGSWIATIPPPGTIAFVLITPFFLARRQRHRPNSPRDFASCE
jgi:uncharacterized membrane protein